MLNGSWKGGGAWECGLKLGSEMPAIRNACLKKWLGKWLSECLRHGVLEGTLGNGLGSIVVWLSMIYCLQTVHEPACVILTLYIFVYLIRAFHKHITLAIIPILASEALLEKSPVTKCYCQ